MADDFEDPREVPWHPRHCKAVLGHGKAQEMYLTSFRSGRPHHAWLISGPKGIGKASMAYELARSILSQSGNAAIVERWIGSRSHPDLAVLERGPGDSKPQRLKSEIVVDDARKFLEFFSLTSGSGGWRIGIVDNTDDLNVEAANALLKLVEEPPARCLFLLLCNTPGRLLRTLRSRCMRLPLHSLPDELTRQVVLDLPLDNRFNPTELEQAAQLSGGRPGHALELLGSNGAKAFHLFASASRRTPALDVEIGSLFGTRANAVEDYRIFMSLLLSWIAAQASRSAEESRGQILAELHAELARETAITGGYNLDRRVAVMQVLLRVQDALKAA